MNKLISKIIIIIFLIILIAVGFILSHLIFFRQVYLQNDSPNKQLRITLYQLPRFGMSPPGQGSDGPGILVLTSIKESKLIYITKIDICNTISTIYWEPEEVIAGNMITIPIPKAYYDSTFYKNYYEQKKIAAAAQQSDTATIKMLLNSGVSLDEHVPLNQNPVYKAAIKSDTSTISWLLKQDDYLQRLNKTKNGIITDQVIIKNTKMLIYLLQSGLDPNTPNYYGYTAVYQAIQFEKIDALKILIENGAIIDTANPQIRYVLHKTSKNFLNKFNELIDSVSK